MYPLLLVTAVTISSYVDAISTRSSLTFERSAPSHQQAVQRFLRDEADTTKEERVSFSLFDSEENAKAAIEKHKNLFSSLFTAVDGNLLSNEPFKMAWNKLKKIADEKHSLKVKYLAIQFGDQKVLEMLKKAAAHKTTEKVAVKLQDLWIASKVEAKEDPTDKVIASVLDLLHPDDQLLSSERFKSYLKLKKRVTTRDNLYKAVAKDLETIYDKDSFALSKMLKTVEQSRRI